MREPRQHETWKVYLFWIVALSILLAVTINCILDQSAVNAIKESRHGHTMPPMRPSSISKSPQIHPTLWGETIDVPRDRNLRLQGGNYNRQSFEEIKLDCYNERLYSETKEKKE